MHRLSRRTPWAVVVITIAMGACTAAPSPSPSMSSADLAACLGVPAPRPTPPDIGPDLYYLDRIYGALSSEIQESDGRFVSMYMDGVDRMIIIGAPHPTKAMCDDLHARYGPWIQVVQDSGPAP